ncbi:UDP-glucose 4-epimerase GalE [Metallumcola ferriviriculae]|uniref:UDP-glucose 4-epimerase n=1 Tax=Metallumcola ferriviriculae TaxID=3039180 RepID=A0AAU0UKJ6_9FIRM|nr:UDP-glucose 4-epimerase GalE [Desulfitibacteraceae bacterium MK1]
MSKVLVTGGAGYIGSHVAKALLQQGYDIIIYDNMENGCESAIVGGTLVKADLADETSLSEVFSKAKVNAVIHFAGYSLVAESMAAPQEYYYNNVVNGLNLLKVMRRYNVKKFVFSSSAAVYGEPLKLPITEKHPTSPTNTYGETKLIFEKVLERYAGSYGLASVSLRYFNAAGADPEGQIGENHNPETHLIPLLLQRVLKGDRSEFSIFGDGYNTPDGTCIRDYVHVTDLARAHALALEALETPKKKFSVYNLGCGTGYSVLQVLKAVERVTGSNIPYKICAPRTGDPAVLVAGWEKIKCDLGWVPEFNDLDKIIATAWCWLKKSRRV